ncbi:REST corepressor isoform X2 [Drosophila busckii]|uniref:REST corepressor isoform X2 n=1 Tax=Drosophila busckii TaxID=30019 RepID=UPI001432FBE0|nr:REST corepressor isoform X2 [Drosophila busckii]
MVLAERNTSDVVRNGNGRRSRGPSPNTHTSAGGGGGGNTTIGSGSGGGGNSANATNEKATTTALGAGTPESSDDDNSTKRNGKSKAKQSEYEEKIRVGRDYQAVCPLLVPEVERRPELMNERALLVWSPTKEIPDPKLEEYISVAKEKYGYNGEQALGMLFWHKHDLERAVMDLANFTPFPDEWTIEDKVLFEQAFQFHGKSFHRIRQMLPDKSIASLVKYYYSWKKTRHRSSAMDRQEKMLKAAVKDGSENGSEVGSNEESDNDDKIQKNRQVMELLDKDCTDIGPDESGAKTAASTETTAAAAQPRISARWSADEIQVAQLALRNFGKNFAMIAKVLGTKTEAHVRTFYVSNRRRYNLDQIVKEYEALASSKLEEANAAEQSDGVATVAAATTATTATNVAEGTTQANKAAVEVVEVEAQATKKDENAVTVSSSSSSSMKKKPVLLNATATAKSIESPATAHPVSTARVTATSKSEATAAAPTITIVDESDTAMSSSSDVVNSSSIAPAAGAGNSTSTSISTSTLSSNSNSNSNSNSGSSSSSSSAPAKSTTNNHTEADCEEAALPTLATSAPKRDASELNTAELPPAKKVALNASAEFLAK